MQVWKINQKKVSVKYGQTQELLQINLKFSTFDQSLSDKLNKSKAYNLYTVKKVCTCSLWYKILFLNPSWILALINALAFIHLFSLNIYAFGRNSSIPLCLFF